MNMQSELISATEKSPSRAVLAALFASVALAACGGGGGGSDVVAFEDLAKKPTTAGSNGKGNQTTTARRSPTAHREAETAKAHRG